MFTVSNVSVASPIYLAYRRPWRRHSTAIYESTTKTKKRDVVFSYWCWRHLDSPFSLIVFSNEIFFFFFLRGDFRCLSTLSFFFRYQKQVHNTIGKRLQRNFGQRKQKPKCVGINRELTVPPSWKLFTVVLKRNASFLTARPQLNDVMDDLLWRRRRRLTRGPSIPLPLPFLIGYLFICHYLCFDFCLVFVFGIQPYSFINIFLFSFGYCIQMRCTMEKVINEFRVFVYSVRTYDQVVHLHHLFVGCVWYGNEGRLHSEDTAPSYY